jgi:hypothetical protein
MVIVTDEGRVSIDWFDSFTMTVYEGERVGDDSAAHSALLDSILGDAADPEPVRLRRLADYMEAHP